MNVENRKIVEVDQFLETLPEEIQEITVALRNIILDASQEIVEEYKWSMPNYSYNGLVCYLQTAKKHVKLGFHKGNQLQEGAGKELLEGAGKTMRYITLKKLEDLQPAVFTSLILAAMELNV
ncbi:DUF1801 domain-containing protein [Lysinibacillus sp. SGAir0095]|uniref:DUF1801 domain-containing protein n=1 Tax=Lysinibacillus sp. SGAir0095 TaxID=2070463 RepID=UPI0010CD20F0|nr:DUF1801 domain-containing protein [Lysinibacillus sp. SGAir0095]QCR31249.1 DUF1801 domain-containing protein [Lysinibacillus sp. SGAir0095]